MELIAFFALIDFKGGKGGKSLHVKQLILKININLSFLREEMIDRTVAEYLKNNERKRGKHCRKRSMDTSKEFWDRMPNCDEGRDSWVGERCRVMCYQRL